MDFGGLELASLSDEDEDFLDSRLGAEYSADEVELVIREDCDLEGSMPTKSGYLQPSLSVDTGKYKLNKNFEEDNLYKDQDSISIELDKLESVPEPVVEEGDGVAEAPSNSVDVSLHNQVIRHLREQFFADAAKDAAEDVRQRGYRQLKVRVTQ